MDDNSGKIDLLFNGVLIRSARTRLGSEAGTFYDELKTLESRGDDVKVFLEAHLTDEVSRFDYEVAGVMKTAYVQVYQYDCDAYAEDAIVLENPSDDELNALDTCWPHELRRLFRDAHEAKEAKKAKETKEEKTEVCDGK